MHGGAVFAWGRSPRTRGRPDPVTQASLGKRSIPAYAGETPPGLACAVATRVDPRVRGGDSSPPTAPSTRWGRSPRTRGRHGYRLGPVQRSGSIPAYAGETLDHDNFLSVVEVDPRVRGGDSPTPQKYESELGRSPRTRGRLRWRMPMRRSTGSIPAYAGETRLMNARWFAT